MQKGNRNATWLIIAVIIIGVACIPVSGVLSGKSWLGSAPLDLGLGEGPDLISTVQFPGTVNIGSEFTITLTVTNSGTQPSAEVPAWLFFPSNIDNSNPTIATIPSLQPGQSTTVTISFTVPPNLSPGNTQFQIILDPWNDNGDNNLLNNDAHGHTFVLPAGMTKEEYDRLTSSPTYKITGPPFVNPIQGGGQGPHA